MPMKMPINKLGTTIKDSARWHGKLGQRHWGYFKRTLGQCQVHITGYLVQRYSLVCNWYLARTSMYSCRVVQR